MANFLDKMIKSIKLQKNPPEIKFKKINKKQTNKQQKKMFVCVHVSLWPENIRSVIIPPCFCWQLSLKHCKSGLDASSAPTKHCKWPSRGFWSYTSFLFRFCRPYDVQIIDIQSYIVQSYWLSQGVIDDAFLCLSQASVTEPVTEAWVIFSPAMQDLISLQLTQVGYVRHSMKNTIPTWTEVNWSWGHDQHY